MSSTDLSAFSESGLFSFYQAILSELKSRGVIRTGQRTLRSATTPSTWWRPRLAAS